MIMAFPVPQALQLKASVKQAIDKGKYAEAEQLLESIAARDSFTPAKAHVDNALLQRIQLRYAKAAKYWQKAAALLLDSEWKKRESAYYLNEAGYDLYRTSRYSEALALYEQSLAIYQEIGDRIGEGTNLNNISQLYMAQGDITMALTYLDQSLFISKKIGNWAGEDVTLSNIGVIYWDQDDLIKVEEYIARTVELAGAIDHPLLEECRKVLESVRAKIKRQGQYSFRGTSG